MPDISIAMTSPDRERDGVPVTFLGMTFIVARFHNDVHRAAIERMREPHLQAIRAGSIDPRITADIGCRAFCEGVLRGWSDVERNGSPLPFSVDAAHTILSDPRFHDLYDFLFRASAERENFREAEMKEAAGN